MPQENRIGIQSIPGTGRSSEVTFSGGSSTVYGRVYDILLTDDDRSAEEMRVPRGTIGAIQFRFIYNNRVDESLPTQTALHLDPNNRRFPLKNEIVEIVSGPTTSSTDGKGNTIPVFYYKPSVDIWGSVEHNSIPDTSYKGAVTGDNFTEKGGITRLQHLPGDAIQEGRFGNSIRIGSSNKSVQGVPWRGPDGSPAVIIRNGQSKSVPKGALLTIEDINSDGGSLYFLSDQTIGFTPASLNFDSYHQDVEAVVKSNVVTHATELQLSPVTSSTSADNAVISTKDTPPVIYQTQTIPVSGSRDEEISFLPDKEAPIFYQEFEEDVARHVTGDNSNWIKGLNSDAIVKDNALNQNALGGFDPYFMAYMQHQQGPTGLYKIITAAKAGSPSVPITWKSNFDSKGNCLNINWNMYGYKINAPGFKYSNVGNDFDAVFGKEYTPANFIKYWKAKFSTRLAQAQNLRPNPTVLSALTKYSSIYGISLAFVMVVCNIESGFNAGSGNAKYKGLFQISVEEFQAVYPNDHDITNIDKNVNVGIRLIKNRLASASSLLNSIQ